MARRLPQVPIEEEEKAAKDEEKKDEAEKADEEGKKAEEAKEGETVEVEGEAIGAGGAETLRWTTVPGSMRFCSVM